MTKKLVSLFLALVITISCFPVSVFASTNSTSTYVNTDSVISVESVSSFAGKTVDVKINISKNPGVAGARLNLSYDNALTLLSVSEDAGVFGILDYTAPSKLSSPTVFNWDSLDAVATENGTILVLTFEISPTAKADDELDILVSYDYGDIYDADLNSLNISMVNGSVNIIDYIPGDVNGDSVVNGKDVTLIRRYNAKWDVSINTLAADVNNDGTINGKDVTLIRRYNAKWDVELLPSTPKCNHNYVWIVDKEATQTSTGLKHESCSLCGDTRNENTVIPVAQHTHSLKYVLEMAETCTQNGNLEYWFCSTCGKYYSDINATKEISLGETIIWPTGHSYQNGVCSKCGNKEYKPLVVSSVSVDKTLLMAKEMVTFHAETNKDSSEVTLAVAIYLNGTKIDEISGTGDVSYVPTQAGRYDVEISVTDGSDDVFAYSLKSCFDVKAYWALKNVMVNANTAFLGEKLTFSADVDGDSTDLDYEIAIYKDGVLHYSVEHVNTLEFSPSAVGTYYAVIFATDSYGESQTAQSGNVIVKAQSGTNPVLTVNYGSTLNVNELNGMAGDEVIVPSGSIKLVWNKNSSDSYYRIRITADNDSDSYSVTQSKYTSTTYSIATGKLTPGNQYTVRLDRYDASGNKIGTTEKFEFTVAGASNSIMLEKRFAVISPVEDNVYMHDNLTVQWTKLNNATKYILSLEYDCGKSDHVVINNMEISETQNSYTIPKSSLYQGCKYTLDVSAYDALGNELSAKIEFQIDGDGSLFEISKPEIIGSYFYENRTGDMKTYPVYEDIVVTWENIPAAEYYAIAVESNYGNISDPILTGATHIERNTFTIPINKLVSGCVYNIRVTVYCAEGHKLTSDKLYFRVPYANGTDLYGPKITSHDFSKDSADPTSVVEQALTIMWESVSAAVSYDVIWCEVGDKDAEFEVKNIKTNTVTIPYEFVDARNNFTDYTLTIIANADGEAWEESMYYVRVVKSAVEAPVIFSPTLANKEDRILPSFDDVFTIKWNAVEGAAYYRVRVWACVDDDYYECYSEDHITSTSLVLPMDELYLGGIFRITIRAYDNYGGSSKTNEYFFQLGDSDYIGLSLDNWNPTPESSHKYISLTTVGAWTAKTSASWITLDKTSGTGIERLKVTVSENTDKSARSGYVTFTNADGGVAILSITQSYTSVIEITSPQQGAILDRDVVTVKWTCKYGYHYFNLTLKDLTTNEDVYVENNIVAKYQQIPAKYFEQGHTYQVTIGQYYDYQKHSEASIVFKIDGDIIPPDGNNGSTGGDAGNNDGDISEGTPGVCNHTIYEDVYSKTIWVNNTIKTKPTHSYYEIYRRICQECGDNIGDVQGELIPNEEHEFNPSGVCSCGTIDGLTNYASWRGINASRKKIYVYETPYSTDTSYGQLFIDEEVIVLGSKAGRYLVEYQVTSTGATKQGYVNTNAIKTNSNYRLEFRFETITLPVSGREVLLIPKNGSALYQLYDGNTLIWKEAELENLTVKFENSSSCQIGLTTITGKVGGYGTMSAYYTVNGENIHLQCPDYYIVADSNAVYTSGNINVFSSEEKDYISMALDIYLSQEMIKVPYELYWSAGENFAYIIEQLDSIMKSTMQGKSPTKNDYAFILASFVDKYVKVEKSGIDDTIDEVDEAFIENVIDFLNGLKFILDSADVTSKLSKSLLTLINQTVNLYKLKDIDVNGLKQLFSNIYSILTNQEFKDLLKNSPELAKILLSNGIAINDFASRIKLMVGNSKFWTKIPVALDAMEKVGAVIDLTQMAISFCVTTFGNWQRHRELLSMMLDVIDSIPVDDRGENYDTLRDAILLLLDRYDVEFWDKIETGLEDALASAVMFTTKIILSKACPATAGAMAVLSVAQYFITSSDIAEEATAIRMRQFYVLFNEGITYEFSCLYNEGDTFSSIYSNAKVVVKMFLNMAIYTNQLAIGDVDEYSPADKEVFNKNIKKIKEYFEIYLT